MSRFVALPLSLLLLLNFTWIASGGNDPTRVRTGMVVSQSEIASQVGVDVMQEGGNAVDAAVATALAMAVTHPTAGNIGGGGFLIFRPHDGDPTAFDFREKAPAAAHPEMWLNEKGEYDYEVHHESHKAVGVPGTVAGLHLAWKTHGKLPWKRLVEPAVRLAADGFTVGDGLERSLKEQISRFEKYPASLAQFTKNGEPYLAGDTLKQPDLAKTLERIRDQGPAGFYEGETAELLVKDMESNGGLITLADMKGYAAKQRTPLRGTYRGYDVIGMPPPSSGGVGVIEMLNILEGFDLRAAGSGSAANMHRMAEAMRRSYADRAQHLGDPDFNPEMPVAKLISKEHAAELRKTIDETAASVSTPESFQWPYESAETTHFSVVDGDRNAVSMTYTLEYSYGSAIVVPGAGFILNNEMGDFNAAPGMTTAGGLIGTKPNLALPQKRMLSSMSPTILAKDGELFMVTGSPGGRTIINTVLQTILNVVDHQMNAQEAVDAGRMHHQWLPSRIQYENQGFSPDTLAILRGMGHELYPIDKQGSAEVIVVNPKTDQLEGGVDRRRPDGGAVGY
ncbi:gamma-glutamyltransferase [Blastopirellula marina]|uniref:Glutathione hydrolase proenzyme n=1 Tax=Blastopirellula marina TaxID=124 RepID=A0A2S8FTH4_9BACT|nr:gamma-glutamyltransferase [Blastopirellula marina]PQO35483.1 gamma-glutamyltransferase [Blastopirellula marina]PQO41343.1 gamma-glutamyltransferase [Blastopirellula marina]PTL44123.1 gamma-glutamyltransferase [Blastopirellula marina]